MKNEIPKRKVMTANPKNERARARDERRDSKRLLIEELAAVNLKDRALLDSKPSLIAALRLVRGSGGKI